MTSNTTLAYVIFGIGVYFLPWIVASVRHANRIDGIVLLNLLLGWTVLGWIGALIWAASADRRPA